MSTEDERPDGDSSPTHNSLKGKAPEESYCSLSLKKTGSRPGSPTCPTG